MPRARGTTTHIQVKQFVLADLFYIYYVAQQFYSRWQPVVHSVFCAAGQLVTLLYRGKINDLTLCPTVSITSEV